ncbi:hypothetical protein [Methanolacinia petrolearia]|uniref:hypothetical protein n=1 Tax=Methanolacinia petrolearia TaxID=54120 RepID=UPI000A039C88|nr:hypothetical protein [Methanolacinia petrolearia]
MINEGVGVSLPFCLFIIGIILDLITGSFPFLTLVTGCLAILFILATGVLVLGEIRDRMTQAPK